MKKFFTFFLMYLIPVVFIASAQDEMLMAHWKLNETSGLIAVDELGECNGTLTNMSGDEWTTGLEGNAIDFAASSDTTAYIHVANTDPVDFGQGQSFSVSVLVKANPIDVTQEMHIVFKGACTVDEQKGWEGKWYCVSFKSQEARFALDDNINKTQLGVNLTQLGYEYPVDQWVHLVGVRDVEEDVLNLYMNGSLIGSMEDITEESIGSGDLPLMIGNGYQLISPVKGQVDDVRIYFKALSVTEVENLYDSYFVSGIFDDYKAAIPEDYRLKQNYPNPFNPTTTIEFDLKKSGYTTLQLFNVSGQLVKTLLSTEMSAGNHKITLNAANYASGIYLYQLKSGGFSDIKKMTIVK